LSGVRLSTSYYATREELMRSKLIWIALLAALLALKVGSCVHPKWISPNHNAAGGYIPACGELPGLVGDDC